MIPQLDHYIGREVTSVRPAPDAEGDADWQIVLAGDIVIRNHDGRRTAAPAINGMSLLSSSLMESESILHFGRYNNGAPEILEEVTLTPTSYSISDSRFPGGPHFPQRVTEEEEAILPKDPSEDRVADGPDEPVDDAEATDGVE